MRNPDVDEFKYDKNHNLVYQKYFNDKEKYMYYDEQGRLVKYSSFGYDYIFDYDGNIPWLEE